MGWQYSHQERADMPKFADSCCPEKRGFGKLFERGKMLKGPKHLSAILRHLQRRADDRLFCRQGQYKPAQLPRDGRQGGAPLEKAVSCPAVMFLLLISDV